MRLSIIQSAHQVDVWLAAPIAVDAVDEGLSVARRTARIDHDDDVSVRSEEFGIPAIAPAIPPGALRAAVDQKLHRILFRGIEAGRPDKESLHFYFADRGEPEGFHLWKIELVQQIDVQMSELDL